MCACACPELLLLLMPQTELSAPGDPTPVITRCPGAGRAGGSAVFCYWRVVHELSNYKVGLGQSLFKVVFTAMKF